MQERKPSLKTKRTSIKLSSKPKRIEDAKEEKLVGLEMQSVEAIVERTELLAKPGDRQGERQGSQEESRGR